MNEVLTMGRGDNRKTPKVRQRRAWRKAKARLAAKISGGTAAGKPAAKKASPSTIVKKKAKAE
jgi:hypothetical protein